MAEHVVARIGPVHAVGQYLDLNSVGGRNVGVARHDSAERLRIGPLGVEVQRLVALVGSVVRKIEVEVVRIVGPAAVPPVS